VLFCPGALKPWLLLSYQWTMTRHLQCVILSETCCGKNAEAAENSLERFSTLTNSRVACTAHQAVSIKVRVCCVRVCNFSTLACFVLAVSSVYKILWKSRVFLDFFQKFMQT
jgi:hypothetical protein